HRRDRTYFVVYEPVHGRPVRCMFPSHMLDDAKAALGARVLAIGEVDSNARGHVVSVKVQQLETMRERAELPSLDDILRIEGTITGGTEATRFIRERWNGDRDD